MLLLHIKCLNSMVWALCKYVKGKRSNYNIGEIMNQKSKINEVFKYMGGVKIFLTAH